MDLSLLRGLPHNAVTLETRSDDAVPLTVDDMLGVACASALLPAPFSRS